MTVTTTVTKLPKYDDAGPPTSFERPAARWGQAYLPRTGDGVGGKNTLRATFTADAGDAGV